MSSNASAALVALGNGSRGAGMAAAGQYAGGLASIFNGISASIMAKADARAVQYAAAQAAARDRRVTQQAVGAARVATAGSGAALDEFAQPAIADIQYRGANDEAMAILAGETRAQQLRTRGNLDMAGSVQEASGSVLRGTSFSGWKGAKSTTPPWYDGTTGDSSVVP